MREVVDVVVVGAGASGLRLAGILDQAGISVAVLEARARVGGRLLSVDPGVDLGATWFWQNENEVREVIQECGLETFPQHARGNMMYQIPGSVQELDGNPLGQNAWRIAGGTQKLAIGLAESLPPETVQMSTKVIALHFEPTGDPRVTVFVQRNVSCWLYRLRQHLPTFPLAQNYQQISSVLPEARQSGWVQ